MQHYQFIQIPHLPNHNVLARHKFKILSHINLHKYIKIQVKFHMHSMEDHISLQNVTQTYRVWLIFSTLLLILFYNHCSTCCSRASYSSKTCDVFLGYQPLKVFILYILNRTIGNARNVYKGYNIFNSIITRPKYICIKSKPACRIWLSVLICSGSLFF